MTDYLVDRTDCFLEVIVELVWNGDWIPGEGERMSQRHKDRRIQGTFESGKMLRENADPWPQFNHYTESHRSSGGCLRVCVYKGDNGC